jgi:tetratricopeptide (TPR) repeat protein
LALAQRASELTSKTPRKDWQSWLFSALVILFSGIALLVIATPRLIGSILRLPGDQAVELVARGRFLHNESYERALASRERSLAWYRDRRTLVELGMLHFNRASQAAEGSVEQQQLYAAALQALEESLALSPAQPIAWLLVASTHYELGDLAAAAEALEWTIRTGRYLTFQHRTRAVIGLVVWQRLDEPTRLGVMESIRALLPKEPDLVALAASAGGSYRDIDRRLRASTADDAALANLLQDALKSIEERP